MLGKSRVVLISQSGWVIYRKELEAARMSSELMLQAEKALERFTWNKFFGRIPEWCSGGLPIRIRTFPALPNVEWIKYCE